MQAAGAMCEANGGKQHNGVVGKSGTTIPTTPIARKPKPKAAQTTLTATSRPAVSDERRNEDHTYDDQDETADKHRQKAGPRAGFGAA